MVTWGTGHLRVHLIWKYENVKMTLCSTALGHQMPLVGGSAHLTGTGHLKRWPNSPWGQVVWKDDLILLLATRCLYWGQLIWQVQVIWVDDLILLLATRCQYQQGVSSSEGTPHLKIWTHFEIYSCFTEVFLWQTNKETFLWILHELDIQPRNSRPYYLSEHTVIPQEKNEILWDPRESASISSEIDHMLNQEYEISASLSALDMMLRQLESEAAPLPSTEEATYAWTVIDSLGTIANNY